MDILKELGFDPDKEKCDECENKSSCSLETFVRFVQKHPEELDSIQTMSAQLSSFLNTVAVDSMLNDTDATQGMRIIFITGYAVGKGEEFINCKPPDILKVFAAIAMTLRDTNKYKSGTNEPHEIGLN